MFLKYSKKQSALELKLSYIQTMNETMERVGGPLGTSATAQAGNAEINRKIEHARQTGQLDVPWDNLPDWHPLYKFSRQLGAILDKVGYNEMYGIELVAPTEEE